jgi:hypothetical protein
VGPHNLQRGQYKLCITKMLPNRHSAPNYVAQSLILAFVNLYDHGAASKRRGVSNVTSIQ